MPRTKVRTNSAPARIVTEKDLRRGVFALRRACPHMRAIHAFAGDPPLRLLNPGLEGLARIIVGQQLSVASAAAIWGRLVQTLQPVSAHGLANATDTELRAAGLSAPKIRTLRALACAITQGALDLDRLADAPDPDVHTALTTVSGIGPWTADLYLLFCAGRADAFAIGDLALQSATQRALSLSSRPSPEQLKQIAQRWRPWRAVAARMLWAYYGLSKGAPSGDPFAAPPTTTKRSPR